MNHDIFICLLNAHFFFIMLIGIFPTRKGLIRGKIRLNGGDPRDTS